MNTYLKKRWVRVFGTILTLSLLLLFLVPQGAKYYLTDWLEKNGADKVTIEKLWFNPIAGRLTLDGVDVEKDGKTMLENSSMVLDLGITALFNKDIRIEKATYTGLAIDLEQYYDGNWRIGSYTLATQEGASEESNATTKEDVASAWAFLADRVLLENCTAHLKTADLDLTVVIERAELIKFTTREGKPQGSFSLKGTINGDELSLDLNRLQIVPELKIGGDIHVSRFKLDHIAELLKDVLPTFTGDVGIGGTVLFGMGSESGIDVEYDGFIEVAEVGIGSESFATEAGNLKWEGEVHYESSANGPILIKTDGILAAKDYGLEVQAANFSTAESKIEIGGKTSVTIAENILVESDGSLLVERLDVSLPDINLTEENFLWQGKIEYDSNRDGEGQYVSSAGDLALDVVSYRGGPQEAAIEAGLQMTNWQGTVVYGQKDEGVNSYIQLVGTLLGAGVFADLGQGEMKIDQEKYELVTNTMVRFGSILDIRTKSSIGLELFQLTQGTSTLPMVRIEDLQIKEIEGHGGKSIAVKELVTSGFSASIPGNLPLDIKVPQIQITDFITDDLVNFTVDGLDLQKPHIIGTHNGKDLVQLNGLNIEKIVVGKEANVEAASINVDNLIFLGQEDESAEKAVLTLGKASFSNLSWSGENGLGGDSLEFEDLVTTVVRDKEGNINISKRLAAMQLPSAPPPKSSEDEDTVSKKSEVKENGGAPLRLGEILVTGENRVHFEDHTLAVPYITDLAINELKINALDSSQPEKKTEILLKGELEGRAPLEVTGHISPFKEKLAMKMKLKLKNYPLSSLSAYTVQSVGTALASGDLKIKTKLALEDDTLDMKNEILLKKLETETISSELAAELNNQLPIPLDAALAILRDSDRNISLDIPLSGPVSDLNVGISDVLITALSKAIIPAASGYLMYTLGPYGALAYVGMKVGEKLLKVDLPPVEFAAGMSELTEEHGKYLERIAKILTDRPETDIQICPQVFSWEFMGEEELQAIEGKTIEIVEEERERLMELGQQRMVALQDHFVEKYSIERTRLLICDVVIKTEKDGVPLVLLQL